MLTDLGAPAPDLSAAQSLVGAALAADAGEVARIRAVHPTALPSAPACHRRLVVRAAAARNLPAVRMLAGLGFDVNAMARADLPIDQEWETALHEAAGRGDHELVELPLTLGADPAIHDTRFDATPSGWAEHAGHLDLAQRLDRPDAD